MTGALLDGASITSGRIKWVGFIAHLLLIKPMGQDTLSQPVYLALTAGFAWSKRRRVTRCASGSTAPFPLNLRLRGSFCAPE